MNRRRFIATAGLAATGMIPSGSAADEEYPGLDDAAIDDGEEIAFETSEFYGEFEYADEACLTVHATFPEERVEDPDAYVDELDRFFEHLVAESAIAGIRLRRYELAGDPGWDDSWDDARWKNRKRSNRLVARHAHTYRDAGAFVWFDETATESYAWPIQAWERPLGLAPYEDVPLTGSRYPIAGSSGYLDNVEAERDGTDGGTFAHCYVGDRRADPTTLTHEIAHLLTNNHESKTFADDTDDADHELGSELGDGTYSVLGQGSGNGVTGGLCSDDSAPITRVSEISTCTEFVIERSIEEHVRDPSDLEDGEFGDPPSREATLGRKRIVCG